MMLRRAVPTLLTSLLLGLPFAACAGGPSPETTEADLQTHYEDAAAADRKRREFQLVLMRLDQGMDSYASAINERGEARADQHALRLEKQLRDLVLDYGGTSYDVRDGEVTTLPGRIGDNFSRLKALAADGSNPDKQAIALSALGFSGQYEVLPLILQGTLSDDPFLVDHAVFGLAVLRAPDTPIGVLAGIVEQQKNDPESRAMAAWAIYQVETAREDNTEICALWRRYLTTDRDKVTAAVQVTAIRGLGHNADKQDADLVAGFLKSPVPLVRMAVTIALGRMQAQSHWEQLLALIGPGEPEPNVRLHARKALAALAGNVDYGYDVAAWRKVFERGQ
ncbi:MAG: hypothetical protein R3F29_06490 [Planctomycetota bacterium]